MNKSQAISRKCFECSGESPIAQINTLWRVKNARQSNYS